jgi:hypothetical protein
MGTGLHLIVLRLSGDAGMAILKQVGMHLIIMLLRTLTTRQLESPHLIIMYYLT